MVNLVTLPCVPLSMQRYQPPQCGTARSGRFYWGCKVQWLSGDELHCPPGKSHPCGSFHLKPKLTFCHCWDNITATDTLQYHQGRKGCIPSKEFMKMSPRSSFEMEDESMEKLNINQHSLSGRDKWDIIIYYEYFSVWNQNTNSQHLAQYKLLQKRLAKFGW